MPHRRRQFRVLYRAFLDRVIDPELLAADGDSSNLLVHAIALLAAFSFVVAIICVPRYGSLAQQMRVQTAAGDQEFMISTTMAVTALLGLLAWNNVLPDRRDSHVLGVLPLRIRTMILAKLAAIGTALGSTIVAANVFTGVTFPVLVIPQGGNAVRSFFAYWLASAAGALFVCCSIVALQSVAMLVLTYSTFQRVSAVLQVAGFFAVLTAYFLKPPFPRLEHLEMAPAWDWMSVPPGFWFFGLFQQVSGTANPALQSLGNRAWWALIIVACTTAAAFPIGFRRAMRATVEQPDIAAGGRFRPPGRAASFLAAKLLAKPFERAIVLFIARSLARSRQHRLLLSAYGGIATAMALAYARSAFVSGANTRWDLPNVPLLVGSFVLLFFAVIATRAAFALPIALPCNWTFRVTAVHSPRAYFGAVRKSLFAIAAAPVWIASTLVYVAIWPPLPVLQHAALLLLIAIVLVDRSLYPFAKMPFACSYLPGKANLRVTLGAYAAAFLFLADAGVRVEHWTLAKPARYAVLFLILLAMAIWARRRTREFAAGRYNNVQFEDVPVTEVSPLDLRRDGPWSRDEAYVDARS